MTPPGAGTSPATNTGRSGPGPPWNSCATPASASRRCWRPATTASPSTSCRHRRDRPAAPGRAVQDRHERLWSSAPNWPTSSAPSSAGSVTRTGRSPGRRPTTPGNGYWNPPVPLLFQRRSAWRTSAVSATHPPGPHRAGARRTPGSPTPPGSRCASPPRFPEDLRHRGHPQRDAAPHRPAHPGHRDINTTMGYKAVYPEEAINGHRAFIARRRALRPAEEYRIPTDEEWEEFLGHFERRKVALGDCARAWGTSCQHEHSCIRCPLLRPDPAQRPRLERDPRQPG